MSVLLAFLMALADPRTAELADGAYAMDPYDLTPAAALEHATAASIAARVWHVDAALLLSIAHHESRFHATERTPETGGRVSCGAMTPEPMRSCPNDGLLGGYLRGAKHLAGWITAMRGNVRRGLCGYAGGYRLLALCDAGSDARGCQVAEVFLARARQIRARRRRCPPSAPFALNPS